MFRRKSPHEGERPSTGELHSLPARLHALNVLLEENRYAEQGLCILAQNGGFVVTGFVVPERGAAYSLVQRTMEIDAETIARTLARLRDGRAGS